MPDGFACGGICDAILINAASGAGGGEGGIDALFLPHICGSILILG